jgi:hypothetical protein
LQNAQLQSSSVKLPDHPLDSMSLADGRWAGEDGVGIELLPQCGIGDLVGDGAADALGAVKVTAGGTGRFFSLVAWRNDGGTPIPAATTSLGDRTPVVSIEVAARRATVVYRTRGDSDPAAALTITRTAVYQVVGTNLVEVSHTDEPYTGG